MKPDAEPKDLDLKLGSKDEIFWIEVQKKCKGTILQCEREILIQKHISVLAEKMAISAHQKFHKL